LFGNLSGLKLTGKSEMTNEELKMTTNQPRSAGRRLWWIIRSTLLIFIMLALGVAVLAGLGYAGYLGVQEIQRSNNSLIMRIDANEQNLDSLRDLVNSEFSQGNIEQQVQINELENKLATLSNQLEALQAARVEEMATQAAQNDTLEAELATAVAHSNNLTSDLETVQAALVALQSDLNSNGGQLDALGGDLDQLRLLLNTLETNLADLSTETAAAREGEAADIQQSITQLQLWGVLTNARLYLIDGNIDGAETAVAQAIPLATILTTEPDAPAAAALQRLQTRLSLAAAGFATDLSMVAQDLAAASADLNIVMLNPIAEPEGTVEVTPTPPSSEESTTETPPPPPSETPLPSPTPTPTATP
jgi:hypothetical protein